MTKERNSLPNDNAIETWNEELARAIKYKEATQKRRAEKLAGKQMERPEKTSQTGRLRTGL